MKFSITSPNKIIEFNCERFSGYNDQKTIIVSEVDFKNNVITDYVFKEVQLDSIENKFSFVTEKEMTLSGIFTIVCFMTDDSKCLMDIFKNYDGNILAYNNKKVLTTNKENLIDLDLSYCVTCY